MLQEVRLNVSRSQVRCFNKSGSSFQDGLVFVVVRLDVPRSEANSLKIQAQCPKKSGYNSKMSDTMFQGFGLNVPLTGLNVSKSRDKYSKQSENFQKVRCIFQEVRFNVL